MTYVRRPAWRLHRFCSLSASVYGCLNLVLHVKIDECALVSSTWSANAMVGCLPQSGKYRVPTWCRSYFGTNRCYFNFLRTADIIVSPVPSLVDGSNICHANYWYTYLASLTSVTSRVKVSLFGTCCEHLTFGGWFMCALSVCWKHIKFVMPRPPYVGALWNETRCLSVRPSVACLDLTRKWKGLFEPI